MNKFLCSLACTWMTIIDSQFYSIDSLSIYVLFEWNPNLVVAWLYVIASNELKNILCCRFVMTNQCSTCTTASLMLETAHTVATVISVMSRDAIKQVSLRHHLCMLFNKRYGDAACNVFFVTVKYVLKRVCLGSKYCTKLLKLEFVYFLGQTSSFLLFRCHQWPSNSFKVPHETHDPKGQENKICAIVKDREAFYSPHTC